MHAQQVATICPMHTKDTFTITLKHDGGQHIEI